MKKNNISKQRPKIYERNPNTGVISWRYVGESPDKFGWPNYGRILKEKNGLFIQALMITLLLFHGGNTQIMNPKKD